MGLSVLNSSTKLKIIIQKYKESIMNAIPGTKVYGPKDKKDSSPIRALVAQESVGPLTLSLGIMGQFEIPSFQVEIMFLNQKDIFGKERSIAYTNTAIAFAWYNFLCLMALQVKPLFQFAKSSRKQGELKQMEKPVYPYSDIPAQEAVEIFKIPGPITKSQDIQSVLKMHLYQPKEVERKSVEKKDLPITSQSEDLPLEGQGKAEKLKGTPKRKTESNKSQKDRKVSVDQSLEQAGKTIEQLIQEHRDVILNSQRYPAVAYGQIGNRSVVFLVDVNEQALSDTYKSELGAAKAALKKIARQENEAGLKYDTSSNSFVLKTFGRSSKIRTFTSKAYPSIYKDKTDKNVIFYLSLEPDKATQFRARKKK